MFETTVVLLKKSPKFEERLCTALYVW